MPRWENNDLLTRPPYLHMTREDAIPYGWDMTDVLQVGETVTSPVVTVTKLHPKPVEEVVTIPSGSATVAGAIVTQLLDGDDLIDGGLYRILVTFTAAVGKRISVMTMLECVG